MPITQEQCTTLLTASKLQPFPSVALRLVSLIQQDTISFVEVGDLLATDAALSATVLRAANSALFGVRHEIKSIPLSLATLGMERISLLILTASVLHSLPSSLSRERIRPWWRHNLATALLCKHLSKQDMVADYSYMCGLLHGIGQLVLLAAVSGRYEDLLKVSGGSGGELLEIERDIFGMDHCELGAAVLRKWNIPEDIVDAAAHHHDPENATNKCTSLVNVSCQVANFLSFAVAPGACRPIRELPPLALETVNDVQLCLGITQSVEALESGLA